ncbi:chalcone isomerase family protein [Thalassotalea sp. PS06]|uniref:chalcone isomerase family protein n=1 Tax=Thalassotalea sp. PS06 TaxID=2594005 RepID=UPI00163D9D5C|nr:chalcone isomerase family protein [Thalassotalea sp. PS06]
MITSLRSSHLVAFATAVSLFTALPASGNQIDKQSRNDIPDAASANNAEIMTVTSTGSSTNGQWQKVGEAQLKVLFWDVYLAKLFTPDGDFESASAGIEHPLRLHLTYFLDIEGEKLAEETEKQWRKMDFEHPENADFIEKLSAVFPDLEEQDSLAIETSSKGEARLFHNQELIYEFAPSVQVDQFLAIWLSDRSTRPKLMKQLTGQAQ